MKFNAAQLALIAKSLRCSMVAWEAERRVANDQEKRATLYQEMWFARALSDLIGDEIAALEQPK